MSPRTFALALCTLWLLSAPRLAAGVETEISPERGIRIRSDDGSFRLRLGGRIHLDLGTIDEHRSDIEEDDVDLRRARPFLSGRAFDDWRFMLAYEFAGDRSGWRQLWLSYRGFERTAITGGNQLGRFGLEQVTSSNAFAFMERSLANALTPSFLNGLSVSTRGERWSAHLGGFVEPIGNGSEDRQKSDGVTALGRFTFAPWKKKRQVVHLGASALYRDVDGSSRYRLRSRPESSLASRLVDTGDLDNVDDAATFGLEAAYGLGPLLVQGEYLRTELFRSGNPDLSFDGGYVQASYFLTGESRRYTTRLGLFRGIEEPERSWGALELAARWSAIDLTDEDVAGGKQSDLTLGLNWYFWRNFRAMFNFVLVDAERRRDLRNDDPKIFQFRLQFTL